MDQELEDEELEKVAAEAPEGRTTSALAEGGTCTSR
jgi:hypothetical protein